MKIAISLLFALSTVLCRSEVDDYLGAYTGHGCYKGLLKPSFLKNVSKEARKEYYSILKNKNETFAQQNDEVTKWAQKHGVENEVEDYNRNMTKLRHELKYNFTILISKLPLVLADFFNVTEDKNQTQAQMKVALDELKAQNSTAFNILRYTFAQMKPRRHCHRSRLHSSRGMLVEKENPHRLSHEEMKDMMQRMMSRMLMVMLSNGMRMDESHGFEHSKDSGRKKMEDDNVFERLEPISDLERKDTSENSEEFEDYILR